MEVGTSGGLMGHLATKELVGSGSASTISYSCGCDLNPTTQKPKAVFSSETSVASQKANSLTYSSSLSEENLRFFVF